MIALALTLALFPLVGAAASLLLRLPLPPSRVAFLFLLGLGAHGATLYALGSARVPLGLATMIAIPLASLAVVVWRWREFGDEAAAGRRRDAGAPRGAGAARGDWGAAIVFAIPIGVLLFAAAVIPTRDYDGRVTWLPKARAIALEHSIAGPFFHGQRGLNLHNRYPLLLPLDAATVMRLSGDTRNEAARWIYVLIPIAALLVMRSMLDPWIAAAVAWLPLLTSIEGGALAAYNDFALGAFAGVAVLYLLEALTDIRALRVVGLFAAFALLAKNEGAALAMAIVIAAIVVRKLRWQVLVPIVVAEAIVAYWRTQVPAAYDEQYEVLIATLPRSISRIPEALHAIARHALQFSEWGWFWIAVVIAIAICIVRDRSPRFVIPLVTIAVALGAYTTALTVTSWNITELAPVAVNRLLAHLIIPAACILSTAAQSLSARTDDGFLRKNSEVINQRFSG